ncbi:MAG TPA: alanine--glyoxylate aminotransferase family protein [Oligoflexus sp.]|uniref:pyridoxal-phosphate-dependent aminotransferase family protein n=1 Tax=Oligoflexus sp. TaxID=1971216 RepID=UPI002D2501F2|nr:alanine--glyoxylate aminotransferase family protein [Oligoflexus sp.]HYX39172.1 alanine--glyoxylate aminotransferase family protein [Oligoflexus sp.]
MRENPFVKPRLFCPGPTPVPLDISAAALQTNIYHRTDAFRQIVLDCRRLLQPFFGSAEAPLILSSSGTGALEAALVNLTDVGDKIIVINGGKFGERWEKLGQAYQCKVISYTIPWGSAPDAEVLKKHLRDNPDCKAVFFQGNETSTGVAYPVKELAAAIRSVSDTMIVVDAVSSLVAQFIDMENWGLDAVVAGSQKGFGIPPGLSFISLSKRAWTRISKRPKFYFDLAKEKSGQDKGETAWTPAISLILSLKPALDILSELGPRGCDEYHARMAKACRNAAEAIGLPLLAQSHPSQALTAVRLPDTLDGSALVKTCRDKYGAIFAGGQDQLKGKIIRVAHLGLVDHLDLIGAVAALEMGLHNLGYSHALGSGAAAAMRTLA